MLLSSGNAFRPAGDCWKLGSDQDVPLDRSVAAAGQRLTHARVPLIERKHVLGELIGDPAGAIILLPVRPAAGKVRMGTGYRVRTTGEIVLVATLGNPKQSHVPPTIFDGIAREHSRKPEEFYDLCDRVMPRARRADVFAREQRSGWHAFGNEVTRFNPEVAA